MKKENVQWLVAILLVIAIVILAGIMEHKHVQNETFSKHEIKKDAPGN